MKVIVFGSTGTVGRHIINQSLNNGHEVTAFSRSASKLSDIQHPNLSISEGDVLNSTDVTEAIAGHDAVVIALGSGKSRTSTVRSEGTRTIIDSMKATEVKRLVCLSTLGAGDSKGNLNFFWKYIMFGWFLKKVFLDHELQESHVKNSGLDYTIVRAGSFTDGDITGKYRHGFKGDDRSLTLKVSRADVADFMLKQLGSSHYLYQTPGISY